MKKINDLKYLHTPPLKVVRTYKYRLYPNKSQQTSIQNQFSMCRHLFNWSVGERQEAYDNDRTSLSYYDQQNKLPSLKQERPWFKGVHSQSLQVVLATVDKSYQSFYRHIKTCGTKPTKTGRLQGYPRFKKRGQWNTITYPQYRGYPAPSVYIPKLGNVKLQLHRQLPS